MATIEQQRNIVCACAHQIAKARRYLNRRGLDDTFQAEKRWLAFVEIINKNQAFYHSGHHSWVKWLESCDQVQLERLELDFATLVPQIRALELVFKSMFQMKRDAYSVSGAKWLVIDFRASIPGLWLEDDGNEVFYVIESGHSYAPYSITSRYQEAGSQKLSRSTCEALGVKYPAKATLYVSY